MIFLDNNNNNKNKNKKTQIILHLEKKKKGGGRSISNERISQHDRGVIQRGKNFLDM